MPPDVCIIFVDTLVYEMGVMTEFIKSPEDFNDRYSRQILYEPIGVEGQRKLAKSRVLLVGCGALGTNLAQTLVRAGVGHLRICDRDYIERNNLQRQQLFDEDDLALNLPKAIAATKKLRRMNPSVTVEAEVVDVNHRNIERLLEGADLLLDGTDNFETRYLINDVAVKTQRPWIYGAVIGASGLVMPIVPGETPCLRCVFDQAPPAELNPTCDTAGVIGPAVSIIAGFQAVEAIKLLCGKADALNRSLMSIDVWTGRVVNLNVDASREAGTCACCCQRDFSYLDGRTVSTIDALCGRNAVQIQPGSKREIDFAAMAKKLGPVVDGEVSHNRYLLKARVGDYSLTLFADGRAIVQGTDDVDMAKSLYAKYFGA